MKKPPIRLSVFIIVTAFIVASCIKEHEEKAQYTPYNAETATVDDVVRLANQKYLHAEVSGGDESQSFFIPNEGLIDEYLARKEHTMPGHKGQNNAFISCLASTGLSEDQIPLVRRALLAYENRNNTLIKRHRQELATILTRAEAQRSTLLRQLLAGDIDRPEFHRRMALLRTNLQNALRQLKESNASEFSRSYRLLMQHLHDILEPRQWHSFTDCLKGLTS